MSVVPVLDHPSLSSAISSQALVVCHFWADWCKPCISLGKVFDELAKKYGNAKFVTVEAEKLPEISEKHKITVVPTFILWQNGQEAVEKFSKNVSQATVAAKAAPQEKEDLTARLEKLINYAPVMLFMKGTPQAPLCGFSRQAVEILQKTGARYSSFNILDHPDVRSGLKEYSKWPTFPQLYVSGKLVGGLDIMKELAEDGELASSFPKAAFIKEETVSSSDNLEAYLKKLTTQSPVMLFMKGSPQSPSCGFSNKMVQLLQSQNVTFDSFDILSDSKVREGLKSYSNWPTFPQLYVKGKLVGGLDVVQELIEEGEFVDVVKN